MIDDESLERMLFHARPDTPLRGGQLSEEQESLLHSITGAPKENPHEGNKSTKRLLDYWPVAAMLLLIFALAGTTVSVWPGMTSQALAVTPRVLPTQPIEMKAAELLMGFSKTIEAAESTRSPDVIRYQFWALSFSPDAPPKSMQPQDMTIQYFPEGSKAIQTRALQPRDADGNPIHDSEAYEVDELIFQHTFAEDEPVGLFPKPVADTDWDALLREGEGLEPDTDTAGYFRAVSNVLSEHQLSQAQQSDLVRFLAILPDIQVAGQTVDRLGRSGVSFLTSDGDYQRVLIISPDQGFLAYESIYVGSERTDIPSPAVIDYKAWY